MRKTTLCVVVPAYNEERVIRSSLESLTKSIDKKHIYVVSDGSSDSTARIAKSVVPNVLTLRKNVGKARALARLFKKFQLTSRYEYLFFFDADTRVNSSFIPEIRKAAKAKPACIVGTVTSDRKKLVSAYRVYEYGFSHRFYKNAQNAIGAIVIAPGCTSVYRSDVIDRLDFNGHTLTEDFDLTLQVHYKKLGAIVFCPKARVITQDPISFSDFWKQISRWNTGFWQNYFLHRLYRPNSRVGLETLVLLADFLAWTVILTLALFEPMKFLVLIGASIGIMMLIATATIIVEKQLWALRYVPLFGIFQWANFVSIILSFFRAIRTRPRDLTWGKLDRYSV